MSEVKLVSIRLPSEAFEALQNIAAARGESPTGLAKSLVLDAVLGGSEASEPSPQPTPSTPKDGLVLRLNAKGLALIKARSRAGESPSDAAKRLLSEGISLTPPTAQANLTHRIANATYRLKVAKASLKEAIQTEEGFGSTFAWQQEQQAFRHKEAARLALETVAKAQELVGGALLDVPLSVEEWGDLEMLAKAEVCPPESLASVLLGHPVQEAYHAEKPEHRGDIAPTEPHHGTNDWPKDWPKHFVQVALSPEVFAMLQALSDRRGQLCGSFARRVLVEQMALAFGNKKPTAPSVNFKPKPREE